MRSAVAEELANTFVNTEFYVGWVNSDGIDTDPTLELDGEPNPALGKVNKPLTSLQDVKDVINYGGGDATAQSIDLETALLQVCGAFAFPSHAAGKPCLETSGTSSDMRDDRIVHIVIVLGQGSYLPLSPQPVARSLRGAGYDIATIAVGADEAGRRSLEQIASRPELYIQTSKLDKLSEVLRLTVTSSILQRTYGCIRRVATCIRSVRARFSSSRVNTTTPLELLEPSPCDCVAAEDMP